MDILTKHEMIDINTKLSTLYTFNSLFKYDNSSSIKVVAKSSHKYHSIDTVVVCNQCVHTIDVVPLENLQLIVHAINM